MKSMLNLDLEGRQIKLYPGDTVSKWGEITHATTQGVFFDYPLPVPSSCSGTVIS